MRSIAFPEHQKYSNTLKESSSSWTWSTAEHDTSVRESAAAPTSSIIDLLSESEVSS